MTALSFADDNDPTMDEGDTQNKKAPNDDNNNGPYRVIALDLDGTLLNSQHQLSATTIQGLRTLHLEHGLTIVLATGRAISTVLEHVAALAFPTPLPVVCSNGATAFLCRVVDPATNHVTTEPLFSTTVPAPVARRTMELALQQQHVCQYYVQDKIFAQPATASNYHFTELYKQLTGSDTVFVPPTEFIDRMLAEGLPTKQLVLFPEEEQDATMELFQKELQAPDLLVDGKAATLIRGNLGWFLEILHPNVHKGAGLERLCSQHLNLPLDVVVAFGDGDNDVEFLQMAGHGICMKNGRRVAKEIAKEITDWTNDQDGVWRTLNIMQQQGFLMSNNNGKVTPSLSSESSTPSRD